MTTTNPRAAWGLILAALVNLPIRAAKPARAARAAAVEA
jgi:hypothetical protein